MPSKNQKQHDFFKEVAHSAEFAKKNGVRQSVGRDHLRSDRDAGKFQKKPNPLIPRKK
jgi:hypothetical protein